MVKVQFDQHPTNYAKALKTATKIRWHDLDLFTSQTSTVYAADSKETYDWMFLCFQVTATK